MAACAASTRAVRSQGLPLRVRPLRRLPALSLLPGHMPAHEARCRALGKRRISAPISARMTRVLAPLNPWNRLQALELCLKGAQTLSNLPAQMRNRFVHTVNMGELLLDQETMVSSETALQGLGKQVTFRTHASTRQFGQGAGVSLSLK